MNEYKHTAKFWIGNAMLAAALVMLIFFGDLWPALGSWTMALWMTLAGVGMYLVMQDKGPPSTMPD